MSGVLRNFWPYDEVKFSKDSAASNRFQISTPWIKFSVNVDPSHLERTQSLANKFATNSLQPEDLSDLTWFFSSLAQFPLSYILPRPQSFGSDRHFRLDTKLDMNGPQEMLKALNLKISPSFLKSLPMGWTWDAQAALLLSRVGEGYDPETLFSVFRRFHLLNDGENNRTGELLQFVKGLSGENSKFRKAAALVARQNHYITQECDRVLRSALPLAQSAEKEVEEFISAEAGHDKILAKAIRSMGFEPDSIPLTHTVGALMELFAEVGHRNFLAFALVVDIFERSSYQSEDPFASVLQAGEEKVAARQIDVHREINDSGGHENVALGFLQGMMPVDEGYALEALRLSELATLVVHTLSGETIELIKSTVLEKSTFSPSQSPHAIT